MKFKDFEIKQSSCRNFVIYYLYQDGEIIDRTFDYWSNYAVNTGDKEIDKLVLKYRITNDKQVLNKINAITQQKTKAYYSKVKKSPNPYDNDFDEYWGRITENREPKSIDLFGVKHY